MPLSKFALPRISDLSRLALAGVVGLGACIGGPALAQSASAPPPPPSSSPAAAGKDIVVTGQHIPGSVVVPQAPITTFDEEDIEAYGVDSIADLLDAIAPETNSGRSRSSGGPIILVNGVRIASFRELRDYPPEAIRRVEVFPEEVSLRYGFPPDQRVVNFILKDHFRAETVENEDTMPEQGGGSVYDKFRASMVGIDRGKRLNIAAETDRTTPLTEAARQVPQAAGTLPTVATDPDPAAARTLVSDQVNYSLNATWTVPIGREPDKGTLAIDAAVSRADATALSGLNTVTLTGPGGTGAVRTFPGALSSFTRTDTLQSGFSLNKPFGAWQFSLTTDGTHQVATTHTDQHADTSSLVTELDAQAAAGTFAIDGVLPALAPAGVAYATSTSNSLTGLATMIGHPLRLPAGDVSLTVKAGYAYTGQIGDTSLDPQNNARLDRGDVSAAIDLGIPITSRRQDFGSALGDITLNLGGGIDRDTDAGWLSNWNAGITWGVTELLNLRASWFAKQVAPSLANLGAPETLTYNVPTYDFASGTTVLATTIAGGNRGLANESESDLELGLDWTLPFARTSTLIVEYFDNRSRNIASAFPLLTPETEAAFPGRVMRAADGAIAEIDETPVDLASQHDVHLRWGFNLFGNLGKPLPPVRRRFGAMLQGPGGPPPDGGGPPPGGEHSGGGGPGGPGGGPGGGWHGGGWHGGGQGPNANGKRYPGRWNLSLYHTVEFLDRVTLAQGFAALDLLNGGALSGTGGVARHKLELDAGTFYKGLGFRLSGTWTGPTHVDPLDAPLSSDLRFGALTKVNLRIFIDFNQQARIIKAVPFLKGARASLMVNNIFDSREKVTDATGATPLAYSPYMMDPLGRVLGAEFRKLF